MEFSKISVLAIIVCVAHIATSDLSEDRVSDAWAEFYKSYYEQHSGAQERDHGGYEAPSASYGEPAAPSTGYGAPATSYDSPAYGATFSDVKDIDLLSPETSVCFTVLTIHTISHIHSKYFYIFLMRLYFYILYVYHFSL